MRIVIIDLKKSDPSIVYDLEVLKKKLKSEPKIYILKNKTTTERITEIEEGNLVGYVENISIYRGTFRGDFVPFQGKQEYIDLIEKHLENDKLGISMKIDGYKENGKTIITAITQIFYLYLN